LAAFLNTTILTANGTFNSWNSSDTTTFAVSVSKRPDQAPINEDQKLAAFVFTNSRSPSKSMLW
jgi:hypothetical protein